MSSRTSIAADVVSGRTGPVRWLLDRLRRIGIGERTLKTALGALVAWELGRLIPGNPHPYLAPLTVILVMQATVAQSLTYGVQRGIGVALGVVVALVALTTVGVHGWSIALVIGVALALGNRLRIAALSTQQIAVSALLVMLLGGATDELRFSLLRIADTVVGTAVALALNAAFAPPSHLAPARAEVRDLGEQIAAALDEIASTVAAGVTVQAAQVNLLRAREVRRTLTKSEAAIAQAETSLKYHLFADSERAALRETVRAADALGRAAIQVRVIARAIVDGVVAQGPERSSLAPGALGQPIAAVLSASAAAVRSFVADDPSGFPDAAAEVHRRRAVADGSTRAMLERGIAPDWGLAGELLAVSERMMADLAGAAPYDPAEAIAPAVVTVETE